MAAALLNAAGPIARLIADKAYDTNPLRRLLAEQGTEAVIPSIARRKPPLMIGRRTGSATGSSGCSAA